VYPCFDNRVLDRLAFLIDDSQGLGSRWVYEFDLDFAELSVARLVRRIVRHGVLVPKRIGDRSENTRKLAIEAREERHPAGLLRKRTHLVIRLEEVEPRDRTHSAVRVHKFAIGLHQADSVDRNSCILKRFAGFIESEFAERIDAR